MPHRLKRQIVLIVDDNDSSLGAMARLFAGQGFDVRVASDGADALGKADGVNLVIADYHMPVFNGCELADMLHKKSPGLPVVIVTGLNKFEHPPEKFLKHADTVVYKTYEPGILVRIARNLLAGHLFAKVIAPNVFY